MKHSRQKPEAERAELQCQSLQCRSLQRQSLQRQSVAPAEDQDGSNGIHELILRAIVAWVRSSAAYRLGRVEIEKAMARRATEEAAPASNCLRHTTCPCVPFNLVVSLPFSGFPLSRRRAAARRAKVDG